MKKSQIILYGAGLAMICAVMAFLAYLFPAADDRQSFSAICGIYCIPVGIFLILLLLICGISVFRLMKSRLSVLNKYRELSVRYSILLENCSRMERSIRETAVLRHEWKNHITSLHLLAKQGDIRGLEQRLDQLDSQLKQLSPRKFSSNFSVNIILQNAAARAADKEIIFEAFAPLPEELGIENADLCSLLINMLDNAIEAASHADSGSRRISVSLKFLQNFLAIKCENSCSGSVLPEENDVPPDEITPPPARSMDTVSRRCASLQKNTAGSWIFPGRRTHLPSRRR